MIMSRGGFKVTPNNYEYERSEPCPDWLSRFANEYAQKEGKNAVEVMRERDQQSSLFDRMNAIMNGSPTSPYSSVEEAVADYQKRTGLADFQKLALAQEIIDAGEEGLAEKKTLEFEQKPEILEKYPSLDIYINNVIETQRGIKLPAILYGILETFGRQGIRETDLDSAELVRYINGLIRSKHRSYYDPAENSIGRGVGTETEIFELNDANRDPFLGLMPRRMV